MKKLNHPNVLPILGVCLESNHKSGLPFMILPFMVNGDLKSYLKKKRENKACIPKVNDNQSYKEKFKYYN